MDAELENLEISDECLETVVNLSEGDARQSIMCLQHLKYFVCCDNFVPT